MKYTRYGCFLVLSLLANSLFSISMVYNFRIAQITKQHIFEGPNEKNNAFIALFFDQFRVNILVFFRIF